MSCKSSFSYGYGFDCSILKPVDIFNFVINHEKTLLKRHDEDELKFLQYVKNKINENNIVDKDCLEDCCITCDVTGHQGVEAIISNIMTTETNINFQFEPGCEDLSDCAIILAECMPWSFNETEKNLTENILETILNGYIKELRLDTTPQYMALEYFG